MLHHQVQELLILIVFCSYAFTEATYSIVATDSKTKQVGGAGATCLPDWDVHRYLYRSVPGRAVLHTQGWILERDDPIILKAYELMEEGESPTDVLSGMKSIDDNTLELTSVITIPAVEIRQYGIADFNSTAAFSGGNLTDLWTLYGYSNSEVADLNGTLDDNRYLYQAMGNVVDKGTIAALQTGFEDEEDTYDFGLCDAAGRLMTAMYRVADEDLGDTRCLEDFGTSASGAYIHVDNEDGTEYIHINIIGDGEKEPVENMKNKFKEWREANPCSSCTALRFSPLIALVSLFVLVV